MQHRRQRWPGFCYARFINNRLFRTLIIIVTHLFANIMRPSYQRITATVKLKRFSGDMSIWTPIY